MIVEELRINTGESITTVKELRAQIKEYKNELLNCKQGTEQYNETLKKAANLTRDYKDMMANVNNAAQDFGQRVGNISKTLTGVSGAITAATGAMSLFGVENEETQKKITATMTALIGITEGLSKMDDGVKAFKRLQGAINLGSGALGKFKLALIGTGLGALVVILGSIIANWDEFSKAIGISSQQMEKLGVIAKGTFNVIVGYIKGVSKAIALAFAGDWEGAFNSLKDGVNVVKNYKEGVVAANEDIARSNHKKTAEQIKDENDLKKAQYKGDGDWRFSKEGTERTRKYYDEQLQAYTKDSAEYKKVLVEKEQFESDLTRHIKSEAQKQASARASALKEAKKAAQDAAKEEEQRRKDQMEKAEKAAKYQRDLELSKLRGDDADKYSEKSKKIYSDYFAALEKLYKNDADKYAEYVLEKSQYDQDVENKEINKINERLKKNQEQVQSIREANKSEIQIVSEKYQKLKEAAQGNAEDLEQIDIWYAAQKEKIQKDNIEKLKELNNLYDDGLTGVDAVNAQIEQEQQALDQKYTQIATALQAQYDLEIQYAQMTGQDTAAINQKFADLKSRYELNKDKETNNLLKKQSLMIQNVYAERANAVGSLFDSLSQVMNEGSTAAKGFAIASTTIQTISGVQAALSGVFTTHSGFWDWLLAISQAASIAASGVSSVKQILSTNPDGSNATSTMTAAANTSMVSMNSVAGGISDFSQTLDGASTVDAIKDQKVYVTEHDITDTHKKVNVTQSEATY